ncbi:MAG: cyclic pyranopterin monophosphate synthase MoaC [Bacteroidota bacterium]
MAKKLSHLDESGRPRMVDVSHKPDTTRLATAECQVYLGEIILRALQADDFNTQKGSVFHTAIIAATMAVKKTAEVIPLCHPLPLRGCQTDIEVVDAAHVRIRCTVKTNGPTGVEMEALHGASVAALTIYDMCKALSHDIRIEQLQLLRKTGGKQDFERGA